MQAGIESAIAQFESNYLEETSAAGNIIRGFDNYIKASSTATTSTNTGGGTATRRKGGISDADRIFSRSSVSWNNVGFSVAHARLLLNYGETNV